MGPSHLSAALGSSKSPASGTVSNIGAVAGGAAKTVIEVVVVHRAAVIHAGSSEIVSLRARAGSTSSFSKSLFKTVTGGSTSSAISDHLEDRVERARVNASARPRAIMRLHKARVPDTIISCRRSNTALRLLEHNSKHESWTDLCLRRDLLDGCLKVADLLIRVVGTPAVPVAGVLQDVLVGIPKLIEGAPFIKGGPASTTTTVTGVELIDIGDSALLNPSGKSVDSASQGESSDINLGEHLEGLNLKKYLK